MNSNLRNHIKQVLKEVTETEPLYYKVPHRFIPELGIELVNETDVVFILEIHFDTRKVIFQVFDGDSMESYYDLYSHVKGFYVIDIDELPTGVINIIRRRLPKRYFEFL
jgi:hypothetical protein